MNCPRCGTESWGPFCPMCGAQIAPIAPPTICPRCTTRHNLVVCPVCGLSSPYFHHPALKFKQNVSKLQSIVWNISLILFMILLALNLATLLYVTGALMVPNVVEGGLTDIPVFTIFPTLAILFFITDSIAIIVYFSLIIMTIVYAYIHFSLFDGKGLGRLISSPIHLIVPRLRSRNRWVMVCQLFLASTFFQVTYILILNAIGIETNPPSGNGAEPLWLTMFSLANASVYEEFISRMVMIGLPMFVGSIFLRTLAVTRAGPGALEGQTTGRYLLGSARYLYGGTLSRKSPKIVLIPATFFGLLSSIMFGLAHQGWGAWKLLPAFIAGLALSYVFLRGGFLAAVLLHFAIDYLSAMAVLSLDDQAFQIFLGSFIMILLILGSGFFLYYCIYSYNLLFELLTGKHPRPTTPMPAQYQIYAPQQAYQTNVPPNAQYGGSPMYGAPIGPPPFATHCPYCGWSDSKYKEGKFECLRCKRVY